MVERVFDRVAHFDERSRRFGIRHDFNNAAAALPLRSYTWGCDTQLDQGSEGACTGFAVSHEAAARPVPVKGVTNAIAREVYARAQQLDPWPGEDYEGSTVLAAIKAGKERGWYTEYRWAFGEEDLALAVGYRGPAVLGINWYEGMSTPDKDGIIRVHGRIAGGHAILCRGFNVRTRLYRLRNSWGSDWGVKGDCFISRDDMFRLLAEEGEACIPLVRNGGK